MSGQTSREQPGSHSAHDPLVTPPYSRTYRLGEILAELGGELVGDPDTEIRRLATLESAGPGDLSFLADKRYRAKLRG